MTMKEAFKQVADNYGKWSCAVVMPPETTDCESGLTVDSGGWIHLMNKDRPFPFNVDDLTSKGWSIHHCTDACEERFNKNKA